MSILGKILVVFNVLAALVFAYLAAVDWGQRHAWSWAVNSEEFAMDGLPLDENETDADGTPLVELISDKTFEEMLRPVGGGPSSPTSADKTQMAEVKRRHDQLRAQIDAAQNDREKRDRLLRILVPLARLGSDRDEIRDQINNGKIDDLMSNDGPFEKAFRDGLEPNRDAGMRRQAVAHLLFNLCDPNLNTTDYQRVAVVVGVSALAYEADRQAQALRDMATRVQLAMANEQAAFEKDYKRVLSELNIEAETLLAQTTKLAEFTKLKEEHQRLAQAREQDLTDLRRRLETARAATLVALNQLDLEQQRLFEAQSAVVKTSDKNQDLERQVRQLEKVEP
jgi:hypothetical protein